MWLMPGLEIIPKVNQRRARTVGEVSNLTKAQLKKARSLRWKKLNPEKSKANEIRQNQRRREAKARWALENRDLINQRFRERRLRRWEITPPTPAQARAIKAARALWRMKKSSSSQSTSSGTSRSLPRGVTRETS